MTGDWSSYFADGTETLRNLLGQTDPDRLEVIERRLVTDRAAQGCPFGDYDLAHLQAIHRHLFQDVYAWAGKVRTVNLAKDRTSFVAHDQIVAEMAAVHEGLEAKSFLQRLDHHAFALEAAITIGAVNRIHPFREGNGRTQLEYLSQLAGQAGWPLDLTQIESERWIEASRDTSNGLYRSMAEQIGRTMETGQQREIREALEQRSHNNEERER